MHIVAFGVAFRYSTKRMAFVAFPSQNETYPPTEGSRAQSAPEQLLSLYFILFFDVYFIFIFWFVFYFLKNSISCHLAVFCQNLIDSSKSVWYISDISGGVMKSYRIGHGILYDRHPYTNAHLDSESDICRVFYDTGVSGSADAYAHQ